MDELKIEYLPVQSLRMYERNARKHEKEDVSAIVESIKDFGFSDPIGIWGEKNTIVEGHGRLMAAQMLGMETVPCIRLDHLDDEQRRAYALAHNKTAELSVWDYDFLDQELEDIMDIDMSRFGFEDGASGLFEHMGTDFVDMKKEPDSFGLTLQLPKDSRETVEGYIKREGKDGLVNLVLQEVKYA